MTPSSPRGRGPGAAAGGPRRWRLVRANRDAVPPSARRFMRRARQRRMRAALPWTVIAGVLVIIGLAAWIVYGTSVFGVREVRVVGAEILTPAQVREAAAVPPAATLARVDIAGVQRRVGGLAPVEQVRVFRDWPNTVVVEVVERTAVAAVPQGKQFVIIDRTGVVFRTVPRQPAELPLLRVATPGPEDAATRAGLQVLPALTPQLREQLVALQVEGLARIKIQLRGDRTVIWGDASRSETKAQVASALLARKGNTIDVSAPEVVTIR